jgi:tetratricopeptide (TPR) repeat protein
MFGMNLSIRDQIKVARSIGDHNFDEAIRIMASRLTNTAEDAHDHSMIALCHHWAGRDDAAAASAKKALEHDPKSFESLRLLAYIYAAREEHEAAAHYTRLGLENYEGPPSLSPQWVWRMVQSAFWLIGIFVPRLRQGAKVEMPDLSKPYEEWFTGARQYLEWYEAVYGNPMNPKIH